MRTFWCFGCAIHSHFLNLNKNRMLHYVSSCLSTCLSICLKIHRSIVYRCIDRLLGNASTASRISTVYKHSCLCSSLLQKNHISANRHGVRCPIPANHCPSLTTRLQFWHFVSHKINKLIVLTGHFSLDFPARHVSLPKGKYKKKQPKSCQPRWFNAALKLYFPSWTDPHSFQYQFLI